MSPRPTTPPSGPGAAIGSPAVPAAPAVPGIALGDRSASAPPDAHGAPAGSEGPGAAPGADASPAGSARLGRVGVLLGGRSSEREVSLLSGGAVLQALQQAGVDAHGFDPARHTLGELEAAGFDRVFIALHGRYGEDGTIQGILETLRIPYTGSGVQASAIAMDKITTKRIWQAAGLPTPAWLRHLAGERLPDLAGIGGTIVVKPVSEGSTFGVSKVDPLAPAALAAAIAGARGFDSTVLIEECIVGRELTCALLGEGDGVRALPLVEIRAPGANYDYHNKYIGDDTQYLCPAPVDDALAAAIAALCVRAFQAVGARGWGRIDVMLRNEGGVEQPYLLELNTAPGMTGHSLVPMAARAAGIDFTELVLHILGDARLEIGP
jgi:D-alanine-D-alanine ligase